MTINSYIKMFGAIVLSWMVGPVVDVIPQEIIDGGVTSDEYFEYARNIFSTLTTLIILVTALIRLRKEKKKK